MQVGTRVIITLRQNFLVNQEIYFYARLHSPMTIARTNMGVTVVSDKTKLESPLENLSKCKKKLLKESNRKV